MDTLVEALVVWLVASPLAALVIGVAIARATRIAETRGELVRAPRPDLSLIPTQATTSPEVLRLSIAPPD